MFEDRVDAGRQLAYALYGFSGADTMVLAIPRGGVVVGNEIAKSLGVPLDLIITKKIGAPGNPELAVGAVADDGTIILEDDVVRQLGVSEEWIKEESKGQTVEIHRRLRLYRGDAPYPDMRDKTVIVVDDGIATGSTMKAAIASIRKRGARRVIAAVPVCPSSVVSDLNDADNVVCLMPEESFYAIGQFYNNFEQVTDEEVIKILRESDDEIKIPFGNGSAINGSISIPTDAKGIVLFAHGSGSGRFSPRNRYVAKTLNDAGIATVLMDLLTEEEEKVDEKTSEFRFDIELLADRLASTTEWVLKNPRVKHMPFGYFGASTGAAAALIAAAKFPNTKAVVSRGGRPDLAEDFLQKVNAPALLIVGGDDIGVIELNKKAMVKIANSELKIIPGATHLFEEPGKLEEVARLSSEWFLRYLV